MFFLEFVNYSIAIINDFWTRLGRDVEVMARVAEPSGYSRAFCESRAMVKPFFWGPVKMLSSRRRSREGTVGVGYEGR